MQSQDSERRTHASQPPADEDGQFDTRMPEPDPRLETDPQDLARHLADNLPQTPGIRASASRRAAVLVLLSGTAPDWCVVFQKRAAGIAQAGEISFPGGNVDLEQDHGPVDTALREAAEELGIPKDSIRVLGRLDSLLTRLGYLVDVVVGTTLLPVERMAPNPMEVAHLFSIPVSRLLACRPQRHGVVVKSHPTRIHPVTGEEEVLFPARALALPERYHRPWGDVVSPLVAYDTPEGVIWGLTGDILEDFLGKCEKSGFKPDACDGWTER